MKFKNVFLTGATGFLGIHILDQILKNSDTKVHCLIRGGNENIIQKRFKKLIQCYFKEKYDELIGQRIFIVKGDLEEPEFNLSFEQYEKLGQSVDLIIHAGAIVKHFGSYKQFEKVNVLGTEAVIKFAQTYNIYLAHVSTTSVSGGVTDNLEQTLFTEDDFFTNQKYSSTVYVKSKLEAERKIFASYKDGLRGSVFRIGGLTGRYEDGVFQMNMKENAFYNRMKFILELGRITKDIVNTELEFTPIDHCCLALFKILESADEENHVFHLFNHNRITIQELIEVLKNSNIQIKVIDNLGFNEYRKQVILKESADDVPIGFFRSFNINDNDKYKYPIKVSSTKTIEYLQKIGFTWEKIEGNYINRVINYMKEKQYVNL